MKTNVDGVNVKRFFRSCLNFLLVSTIALGASGCNGDSSKQVEEVEYVSLGDSDNPLKCLVVEKDNEVASAFGYFRFDSDTTNLYFDNILTNESINLTEINSKADIDFYWTEAGNYLNLQQIVDNQVTNTELSSFVDDCSNYSVDYSSTTDYCYRNQGVNVIDFDYLSEEMKEIQMEEMDAIVSDKTFIKK